MRCTHDTPEIWSMQQAGGEGRNNSTWHTRCNRAAAGGSGGNLFSKI